MIDSTLTATRVQGGWAYFDERGNRMGGHSDWGAFGMPVMQKMTVVYQQKVPRNYTRYAMFTHVDLKPEHYQA